MQRKKVEDIKKKRETTKKIIERKRKQKEQLNESESQPKPNASEAGNVKAGKSRKAAEGEVGDAPAEQPRKKRKVSKDASDSGAVAGPSSTKENDDPSKRKGVAEAEGKTKLKTGNSHKTSKRPVSSSKALETSKNAHTPTKPSKSKSMKPPANSEPSNTQSKNSTKPDEVRSKAPKHSRKPKLKAGQSLPKGKDTGNELSRKARMNVRYFDTGMKATKLAGTAKERRMERRSKGLEIFD